MQTNHQIIYFLEQAKICTQILVYSSLWGTDTTTTTTAAADDDDNGDRDGIIDFSCYSLRDLTARGNPE